MQSVTVVSSSTAISADLAEPAARARDYRKAATAANTKAAYAAAWRCFTGWCEVKGRSSLPATPDTVALYLADRAGSLKLNSLKIRVAAISKAHKIAGFPFDSRDPAISEVVSGIARTHGSAITKKAPATKDVLRDAVKAYANAGTLKAKRDKALLCISFYAALRRSEVVAIDVEHITETPEGLVLTLPKRKTDQVGVGTTIGLPIKGDATCPVAAFKEYFEAAQLTYGPVFRSVSKSGRLLEPRLHAKDVARLVKHAVEAAGYDPALFSGHSLRAGFVTEAAQRNVPDHLIAQITGHRSMDTLAGYVRRANLFKHNAAGMI